MSATAEHTHPERFGAVWDRANRRADMLMQVLCTKSQLQSTIPTPFARVLNDALVNPVNKDHNDTHTINVKKDTDFLVRGLSENQKNIITPWVESIALFERFHDTDQLLALQRNEEEKRRGKDNELKVKYGHGKGGAVMMMVLAPEYAEINQIPLEQAEKICYGAAIMMIRHESIMKYRDSLRGQVPVASQTVGQLEDLLDRGDLDQFSLSPKTLITMMVENKKKGHFFVPAVESKRFQPNKLLYGLHPHFETEYKEALAILAADNTALRLKIPEDQKEGLLIAAEVAVGGDILDMIIPPEVALKRLFTTQYSQNRPFYAEGDKADIIDLIKTGDGNGNGHEMPLDSDTYRILWQVYKQDLLLLSSPVFEHNVVLKNLLVANALSQIALLKIIGNAVMKGDYSVFDQFAGDEADLLRDYFKAKPVHKGEPRLSYDTMPRVYLQPQIDDFNDICDQIASELREQSHIPVIKKGKVLSKEGQTAVVYEDMDDPTKVIKQYHHGDPEHPGDPLWGLIPTQDSMYRAELVTAEVTGLGLLGQALGATAAVLNDPGNWHHDVVVQMQKLSSEKFSAPLTIDQYKDIAQKVIDYHFDSRACPEVDFNEGETFTSFIRSLLLGGSIQGRKPILGEVGILRKREIQADYDGISSTIDAFLKKYGSVLDFYSHAVKEPIVGHGDIKRDNIVVVDGKPQILDTAPWIDWQINSRRMDAAFLYADLMVNRDVAEAQQFWSEYDRLYRDKIGIDRMNGDALKIDMGIQANDAISMVYRYLIMYRLESSRVRELQGEVEKQPELGKELIRHEKRAHTAYDLLRESLSELSKLNDRSDF